MGTSPNADQHTAFDVAETLAAMQAQLLEKEAQLARLEADNQKLRQGISSVDSLEKELRYVYEIVNSVQDIVFISDNQGIFRFINPAAERILGFPLSDMLGQHFSELIIGEHANLVRDQYREEIRQGVKFSYLEFPVKNTFGKELWLGQQVTFIYRDGKFFEAHSISRDISAQVQARRELDTTYSRLKGLVENLHAGVLVENEDRKIVLVNQQFCDLFNIPVPPEYLIGADCAAAAEQSKVLFTEPDRFVQRVDDLLSKRVLTLGDDLFMCDGKILERHYIPVFSGEKYLGHMWHYRDVTAQRAAGEQLRKSEEKYRGIMENMELGLLEVNAEGKIIRAYPHFCAMVGYSEEELVGHNPIEIFAPPGYEENAISNEQVFLQGKSVLWENPIVKKNGSIMWALVNHTPIYNESGQLVGTLGIHLDITEQKMLQSDLERARFAAEEARDAEKAFLANMSHEIRNPINSIVGMVNLLYDTRLNKEQLEYVNTLKYSAELLHALVSDVLDMSKIDQGKMEPKLADFELGELVRTLSKTFEFRLAEKQIRFRLHVQDGVPERIHSDPTFVNQILLNLLSNAFKFTERGQIDFGVDLEREGTQAYLCFKVKDTGVGIEPDRIPFIFERFNQAGKPNKGYQDGTGLGLPITKQLVELLGGTIHVQSTPQEGTTFVVRLPFAQATTKSSSLAVAQPRQKSKRDQPLKALIVEDNPMNRLYLENLLAKWGLQYTSAEDGLMALQIADQQQFDLILMDIRMPNLDGYDTTLRLRSANQNPNQQVPIIALTASALLDEKEKALQAGMNQHLSKPFTPDQLKTAFQQFYPDFSPPTTTAPITALNRAELEEIYEEDRVYMQEIFNIFVQTTPSEIAQMRQALLAEDWKTLAAKAHKIKPSFQMVGLGGLCQRTEQLEQYIAKDHRLDHETFDQYEIEVLAGIKLVEAELEQGL